MFRYFGKVYKIKTSKTHFCNYISELFVNFPIDLIVKITFYIKHLCGIDAYIRRID